MKLASDPAAILFRRGDANTDGGLALADPVSVLTVLFTGGMHFPCADAADADDSGSINVADPLFTMNHLFSGGPAPSESFERCGADPTEDRLGCAGFAACTGG